MTVRFAISLLAPVTAYVLGVWVVNRWRSRRIRRRLRVLAAFHTDLSRRWHVSDVEKTARLPGGSVYPELAALETSGVLASGWEDGPVPRRRLYWLATRNPTEGT